MSRVTDIVLLAFLKDPGVAEVNAWLRKMDYAELKEIDQHAGGHKALQAEVWSVALNYFEGHEEELVEVFRRANWKSPELAVLIYEREEDDRWTIIQAYDTQETLP